MRCSRPRLTRRAAPLRRLVAHGSPGEIRVTKTLSITSASLFTQEVSLALECLEVIVDAIGRTNVHVHPDLTDRGGISPLVQRINDELQDLRLSLRKLLHIPACLLGGTASMTAAYLLGGTS